MNLREVDKRLDALENRLSTEYVAPVCWIYFGKDSEVSGWRHKETDEIFWRETDETSDALRNRILSLTGSDRNQVFIAIM